MKRLPTILIAFVVLSILTSTVDADKRRTGRSSQRRQFSSSRQMSASPTNRRSMNKLNSSRRRQTQHPSRSFEAQTEGRRSERSRLERRTVTTASNRNRLDSVTQRRRSRDARDPSQSSQTSRRRTSARNEVRLATQQTAQNEAGEANEASTADDSQDSKRARARRVWGHVKHQLLNAANQSLVAPTFDTSVACETGGFADYDTGFETYTESDYVEPTAGATDTLETASVNAAPPEEDIERPRVPTGSPLTFTLDNLPKTPGIVIMKSGPLVVKLQLDAWQDETVAITLPLLELMRDAEAEIYILSPEGKPLADYPVIVTPVEKASS